MRERARQHHDFLEISRRERRNRATLERRKRERAQAERERERRDHEMAERLFQEELINDISDEVREIVKRKMKNMVEILGGF